MGAISDPATDEELRQLFYERQYEVAIEILNRRLAGQSGGERGDDHALLALAYFQSQEYASAARHATARGSDPFSYGRRLLEQSGKPERGSGLANVKSAFEPWDTAERLDPDRHPLRGFAKELKPEPWARA